MKHLFIVNPVAGGTDRTAEIRQKAASIFRENEQYEVYTTRCPGDAADKVRAEADYEQELRVYAVGGDGTLNSCVNGAYGRANVAVSVYPSGTGNDFVRMFGDEKDRFLDIEGLVNGEVHPLDLIKCGDRYGINICSVGIDARIGTEVHKYTSLPVVGKNGAYICSAAVNFFRGINQHMVIRCGNRVIDGKIALVCACNGQYYGGGFHPVPDARPDDGRLDFIVVRNVTRSAFVRLIGKYAKGQYREIPDKYLTYMSGSSLTIESDEDMCVNLDGEADSARSLEFRLVRNGINFIFPPNMAFFENRKELSEAK